MREIKLSNGRGVTLVDDEDYELLSQFRWRNNGGYATGRVEDRRVVQLHRFLLAPPKGMLVDHINHNGLDNRRCNLRVCTPSQNAGNRKDKPRAASGYWGVYPNKGGGYVAVVAHNILGKYADPVEAALARDRAALRYFGDFATLNFPQDEQAA